jgi:hypothetical protein
MAALALSPLPGAGRLTRLAAVARSLVSRRALLRLAGIETVMLEGRVYAVRAVPLGIARSLVPALIRCSRRFAEWQIDEALYDDMVKVLALGLGAAPAAIERLTVPLWDLGPVVERIARVNGLPMMEVGGADLGELLSTLTHSTGTSSLPSSSAVPAGPSSTSSNA